MATAAPLKDAVREHYDRMAYLYRIFWGDHLHHGLYVRGDEKPEEAQVKMLEQAAALARVRPGSRVLDAGCGHGGTALYLAEHFGCEVTGVTLSPRQAQIARAKAFKNGAPARTRFVVGDLEEMAFLDGAFDLVWVMESSEHFANRARFFAKAARWLRAGGKLLLAAWTAGGRDAVVREVANRFLCPAFDDANTYKSYAQSAGLIEITHKDLSNHVWQTWEICAQRVRRYQPVVRTLPLPVQEFVAGMDLIRQAYGEGTLRYSLMVFVKT